MPPGAGRLALHGVLAGAADRPPLLLVHGAASSAAVWTLWQREAAALGWSSLAVDLRGHGASAAVDLASVSMADYVDDVASAAARLAGPPVMVGWSMGGLVALMAAARGLAAAVVGLGPSPPARVRDAAAPLRPGTFGPEEYGIADAGAADQPTMPDLDAAERRIALASLGRESRLARDERKAGVVLDPLPCPALVIAGTEDASFPPSTYATLPFAADVLTADGASHWGLVLGGRTVARLVPQVLGWVAARLPRSQRSGACQST